MVDFRALEKLVEPWAGKNYQTRNEAKIRLKVINMESRQSRICVFNEAKTWDRSNPVISRIIDGRHVKSFDGLIEIIYYKVEKSYQEVDVY
ncbi:MAG: hypothetical protein A2156_06585 [Deltaproteobacteria bacterium RBG_16_48_10]|nr:MAG: hypothetical protein A2156_06585 [Deltaproteobacteria bacterium RBG_16_48_10]